MTWSENWLFRPAPRLSMCLLLPSLLLCVVCKYRCLIMYSMYFPREANTHCHDLPFEKSIVYTSPMSSTRKMGVFSDGVLPNIVWSGKWEENLNGFGFPRAFGNHKEALWCAWEQDLLSIYNQVRSLRNHRHNLKAWKVFFQKKLQGYQGPGIAW